MKNSLPILFVIFFILGCARQNSPTGGEKDIDPPQVVSYDPPLLATNFTGNQFEIEFDEYIQVKDLTEQLVVSPPLDKNPEYTLRGKKMIISWEEDLEPDATYQFNFGSSVADITEGNANTGLIYVFSTGSSIDSLSVQGSVLHAEDNSPAEGVAVMFYREMTDSLPLTRRPDFFALTDPTGRFRMRYLPEGSFKVFALLEESSNYLYDGPPEKIGFISIPVPSQVEDSLLKPVIFPLFTEKDTVQYIVSGENRDYGFHEVVFNLPADDPTVEFFDVTAEEEIPAISVLSASHDTLSSWLKFDPERPFPEEIRIITTLDTSFADTTYWYPEIDPEYREEPELVIKSNLGRNKLDPLADIRLNFNHPIAEVDTSLISLFKDSVHTVSATIRQSISGLTLFLEMEKTPDADYMLIMKEGAVRDVFGIYSDSTAFRFRLEDDEFYGRVILTLNDSLIRDGKNPFLELLNEKGTPVEQIKFFSGQPIIFDRLSPGKYSVRITMDRNGNGEWDTGDYSEKRQPEFRLGYPETLDVRSNWELEIDWTPAPIGYTVNPGF